MEPLTLDTLRALATAQGLALTDEELATLLPLVQAGRALIDALADLPLDGVEPSCQYRMF